MRKGKHPAGKCDVYIYAHIYVYVHTHHTVHRYICPPQLQHQHARGCASGVAALLRRPVTDATHQLRIQLEVGIGIYSPFAY